MLSMRELARLQQSVAGTCSLSVYLANTETDPAQVNAWKRRALNAARAERQRIVEARAESTEKGHTGECLDPELLSRAWELVESVFPAGSGALGSRGWVAFANGERILHSSPLAHAPETVVHWGPAIRITPYLRVLSSTPDLLMVLADARRARLLRVTHHDPLEVEDLIADRAVSEGAGPGMMKAASSSSGVRGETRRDAARRATDVATERLIRSIVQAVESRANQTTAVILGGNERVATNVRDALDDSFAERVFLRPDLEVTMSDADIDNALGTIEEEVRARRDEGVFDAWSGADGGRLLSVAGWNDTLRAINQGAVEELLLSSDFVDAQPDDAESLIAQVLGAGGSVCEVAGDAGRRLDGEGRGVGARLRFAP